MTLIKKASNHLSFSCKTLELAATVKRRVVHLAFYYLLEHLLPANPLDYIGTKRSQIKPCTIKEKDKIHTYIGPLLTIPPYMQSYLY